MRKRSAMCADGAWGSRDPRPCGTMRVPVRLRRTQCQRERCNEQQRDRRSKSMDTTVKLARYGQHLLIVTQSRTGVGWWSTAAV